MASQVDGYSSYLELCAVQHVGRKEDLVMPEDEVGGERMELMAAYDIADSLSLKGTSACPGPERPSPWAIDTCALVDMFHFCSQSSVSPLCKSTDILRSNAPRFLNRVILIRARHLQLTCPRRSAVPKSWCG